MNSIKFCSAVVLALSLTGCYRLDIPHATKLYEEKQAVLAEDIPQTAVKGGKYTVPAISKGTPLTKYSYEGRDAYCIEMILMNGDVTPCWYYNGSGLVDYIDGGQFDSPVKIIHRSR